MRSRDIRRDRVLSAGKTVIAIVHRLLTIAGMDRIVAKPRTHAELLARNGRYSRLRERQSGGFVSLEAAE